MRNQQTDGGRRLGQEMACPEVLVLPLDILEGDPHPASYCMSRGNRMANKATKIDLLQGTLDLIVLKLLRAGPANGWQLTQSIQAISRGVLDVNYGSLYPALRRLEARGWVVASWGASENNRRARYYQLTTTGRRQLEAERATWERFSHALGLILQAD